MTNELHVMVLRNRTDRIDRWTVDSKVSNDTAGLSTSPQNSRCLPNEGSCCHKRQTPGKRDKAWWGVMGARGRRVCLCVSHGARRERRDGKSPLSLSVMASNARKHTHNCTSIIMHIQSVIRTVHGSSSSKQTRS